MSARTVVAVLALLFLAAGRAAARVPELRVEDERGSTALELVELSVHVTQRGHLARTAFELTYRNPRDRDVAGDFLFPLPEGATVADVALDFDGRWRSASVVERKRGRRAFTEVVHRQVDPALAEWMAGNTFRLGVYPVPAGGTKGVRVVYDQELALERGRWRYRLDLRYGVKLDRLEVEIDADSGSRLRVRGRPQLRQAGAGAAFRALSTGAIADGEIQIDVPPPESPVALVEGAADGGHDLSLAFDLRAGGEVLPPASEVVLLWDASGSMAASHRDRLLAFLRLFLARQGDRATLSMVPFDLRRRPPVPVAWASRPAGQSALAILVADLFHAGGTDLLALFTGLDDVVAGLPEDARLVLVSDGLDVVNERAALAGAVEGLARLGRPLLVLSASEAADGDLLRGIARATRGWYLSLARHDPLEGLVDDVERRPVLASLHAFPTECETMTPVHPVLLGPGGRLHVTGRCREARGRAALTVRLDGAGETAPFRDVVFEFRPIDGAAGLIRSACARAGLDRLLADPAAGEAAIAAFGIEHRMLTPATSLIVLERAADYVAHGIEPPPGLAEEEAAGERAAEDAARFTPAPTPPPSPTPTPPPTTPPPAGEDVAIDGQVVDGEGLPLPGVTVTVRDQGGHVLWTSSTDAGGNYRAIVRGGGPLQVEAVSAGFNAHRRILPERPSAPLVLTLRAEVMATVEVAAGPLAYHESSVSSSVVDGILPGNAAEDDDLDPPSFGPPPPRPLAAFGIAEDGEGDDARPRREVIEEIVRRLAEPDLAAGDRRALYEAGRARFSRAREYYFAVSDRLRGDDPDFALRALTDVLEAGVADPGLLRFVAARLAAWSETHLAAALLDRAMRLAPDQPQSARHLILLLARTGALERASTLAAALVRPAAAADQDDRSEQGAGPDLVDELEPRFPEVASIVAGEVARLEAWRASGSAGPLDLEVDPEQDLAAILTWDSDQSDVDLHVIEPSGEEVFYSNRTSAGGGALSEDMTRGYGPELYRIARAAPGEYRIEVLYFGGDRAAVDIATLAHVVILRRDANGAVVRDDRDLVLGTQQERLTVATIHFGP